MMRSVDRILISNWTDLEDTVPVSKYSVDIIINWTDNDSDPHEHVETVVFPNVLSGVPNNRLKQYMKDIILSELRIQQGIDEE